MHGAVITTSPSTGPQPQLTPLHNLPTGHSVPQPLPHFPYFGLKHSSSSSSSLLPFLQSLLHSLSPGCSHPPPPYQGGCPSPSQHPDQPSNSTNLLLCLTSLRMWQDSHPPLPKCWLYSKSPPPDTVQLWPMQWWKLIKLSYDMMKTTIWILWHEIQTA